MDDKKCCCHEGHGKMMMECCQEHMMTKEHLEAKKEKLEKKLEWVNEKLAEAK